MFININHIIMAIILALTSKSKTRQIELSLYQLVRVNSINSSLLISSTQVCTYISKMAITYLEGENIYIIH